MNIKYNILPLFAAVSLLTACSDDDIDRIYTVGEADNAIVLRAGVNEGGAGVETRSRDDNHANHKAFTSGTKLALRIDGKWNGHTPANISQQTIATLGGYATGTDDKHNQISGYNPVRYWDDYGTADPANAGTGNGREKGLTIYGIGVDGVTTDPTINTTAGSSWTDFSWSVCSSGEANSTDTPKVIDQTNGWANYDLLTSNNIHAEVSGKDYDGTYKFDDYLHDKNSTTEPKQSSNILEFTHAMTKITVQLTAGEGFPITDGKAHFENAPTVTLEGFYYKGSVNVEDKISTKNDDKANIKMHLNEGGAAHTATFDALVFPGNTFSATIANDDKFTPTSSNNILELNADGNIYKVTAAQLVKAIVGTSKTDEEVQGTLEQGKNYILNITVKKTDLDITATILDWKTVEAEEVEPKINVDKVYGHEGTAFKQNFDFFRSTSKASGYSKDAWVEHTESSGTHTYTFHDQLYWPDHQTHYFFRGVYPQVGTEVTGTGALSAEAVSTVNGSDVIAIANAAYTAETYPSDLAFGWPKTDGDADFDETCKVHTNQQGICATEGQIRMNFKYMMSQVEVELKTVDSPDAAKVNIGTNTVVELVNVYNTGEVKLSDGTVTGSGEKGTYNLDAVAGTGNECKRHSAIVPQELTFTEKGADTNLRFKITVTNTDSTQDVYYADVNPIKEKNKETLVAPTGKWESGVHYKYTLTLSKTAINVTATLTDWVTVEASDEVWF